MVTGDLMNDFHMAMPEVQAPEAVGVMKHDVAQQDVAKLVSGFPGGYWRHDIVDHVLLVNSYFPPERFLREIRDRLPALLSHYPSVDGEIETTLAGLIGQPADRIVACNGVAEIIAVLLKSLALSVAVPTPSFNAYENHPAPGKVLKYALEPPHFRLDVDDYAARAIQADVDACIVISPHNPTSQGVPQADLLRLASRLQAHGKLLIVDESFVEFAPHGAAESLESKIDGLPNVIILKSLGKIYGICGLRVGYLLSTSTALVGAIRRALPLWNINVIAEFVLSRLAAFKADAEASWTKVKFDRDALYAALCAIPQMEVVRPHGNFVFGRLPPDWPDGPELARRLLTRHNVLIRHCESKTMAHGRRYVRIAARTAAENIRLVDLMREVACDRHDVDA
jgi:threonine-phosphate decarboxylase